MKVRGKTFAVLRSLANRPGQLVTKDELFRAVWPGTVVSEATLTACIKELRQALRDDARTPRYIETAHGQGFRFIAAVTVASVPRSMFEVSSSPPPALDSTKKVSASFELGTWNLKPETLLVGRTAELTQLHGWLAKALGGQRQIVFVTGEPGIGKTTLVEAFRQRLEARDRRLAPSSQASSLQPLVSPVSFAHGQCIEHCGVGEAYLPILAALGRLCREPDGQHLIELLSQHAPTWLVQMPALLHPDEIEALHRKTAGATRERMLRELAEALEVITAERPLILWLEDLHWSDVSTLDWLAFVARRQELARLLVLGTYRPVDVMAREHPLKTVKQELQLHGHCQELALDFLREGDVAEYLAVRFPVGTTQAAPLRSLARVIHRRTDGNPLFMVNLIEHLLSQGVLVQTDRQWVLKNEDLAATIPENLRQLIEQQMTRISPDERKILEAASVAGAEFSAAAVAAAVETTVEAVEEQCTELARREQFLRTSGTVGWPDGTVTARYSFLHALYQDVLYERLTARRRQRLHQQIGEREEQAYGEKAREIAAELAVHFERGRDYGNAVQYLQYAGENALRRSANQEAVKLLTKGLKLLNTLPDTPERTQRELLLQTTLGPALMATRGMAAPEVRATYTRARELCLQLGETPQIFPILLGLWRFYNSCPEYQTARALAEQLLRLTQSAQDRAFLVGAHHALGATFFLLGEFVPAREHLEQGIALDDPQQHHFLAFLYGQNPGVACRCYASIALWNLGYPDQALKKSQEALALAQELSHPFTLAMALNWAAGIRRLRGEGQAAQELAEALLTLSREQGYPYWSALGTYWRTHVLAEQGQGEGRIAQMHQGLAAFRATGAGHGQSVLLCRLGKAGRREDGLNMLAEALVVVDKTGERCHEAELYRLKGELTFQQESQRAKVKGQKSKIETSPQPLTPSTQEAEACFLKAIEVAQKQQAKSLELRATMSLARLWQSQGKTKQAHKMLSKVYNWFTEGFDTKDLQEAKALLEVLH